MSALLLDPAQADRSLDDWPPLTFQRRSGVYAVFAQKGSTLEAWKLDPLGVKAPAPSVHGEAAQALADAEARFLGLGERLSALKLAAAPKLHAVRRREDGCFWLLEAPGTTLQTWLDSHPGPVPAGVLATFIRRLGAALEDMHGHGVVHGALSPKSICIDGGELTFTGFGVDSRAFFRSLGGQAGLVEPGYAPPEAHDGAQRQPIGPAADLYAAAAVVLRLAAGTEPPAATDLARLTGASVWPEEADVAPGIRAAVETAMALATADRSATAAAWLAGFHLAPQHRAEWFAGAAAPNEFAIPEPPGDALSRFGPMRPTIEAETPHARRSGRGLVAGLALAGVAASAAAGFAIWRPAPKPPASIIAAPAPAPKAPVGCAWIASGPSAWRLGCGDGSAPIVLPDGFGVRTVTLAEAGEVRPMERLGTFYRLRAKALGPQAGAATLYQAHDWLGRAADTGASAQGEDARAKDDAALALGAMLARGEGGRAPNAPAAEQRLRQAAAGNRADTVLALAIFLRESAAGDASRLAEARQLFWRVAQLKDSSPLQQQAAQALSAIDAAAAPAPVAAPPALPDPPASPPKPEPAARAKPAKPEPAAKPPAAAVKPVAKAPARPKPEIAKPVVKAVKPAPPPKPKAVPPPSTTAMGLSPRAAPFTFGPSRHWTASAFIQVDPDGDFEGQVQRAGQDLCRAQGGRLESARQGEIACPNGVNYCQVRAVASCEGE